jgi:hypothetical protein
MDKDTILQRAAKLLALAANKGATYAEAENALTRAQALLARHALTAEDVAAYTADLAAENVAETPIDAFTRNVQWRNDLARMIAGHFRCRLLRRTAWTPGSRNRPKIRDRTLLFVGTPTDASLAAAVYAAALATLTAQWNRHAATAARSPAAPAWAGPNFGPYGPFAALVGQGATFGPNAQQRAASGQCGPSPAHGARAHRARAAHHARRTFIAGFIAGLDARYRAQEHALSTALTVAVPPHVDAHFAAATGGATGAPSQEHLHLDARDYFAGFAAARHVTPTKEIPQ